MARHKPTTTSKIEDRITLHRSREDTHEVTVSRVVEVTECEKLAQVAPESQKLGEFIDWLRDDQGITLCIFDGRQFQHHGRRIEELLADYFEIDLDKVETERRALLDAMRESHANHGS